MNPQTIYIVNAVIMVLLNILILDGTIVAKNARNRTYRDPSMVLSQRAGANMLFWLGISVSLVEMVLATTALCQHLPLHVGAINASANLMAYICCFLLVPQCALHQWRVETWAKAQPNS